MRKYGNSRFKIIKIDYVIKHRYFWWGLIPHHLDLLNHSTLSYLFILIQSIYNLFKAFSFSSLFSFAP